MPARAMPDGETRTKWQAMKSTGDERWGRKVGPVCLALFLMLASDSRWHVDVLVGDDEALTY